MPALPKAPVLRASAYRPIADYGIVGNCHTAALISSEGSIDWMCAPSFDSPPLFARLLDAGNGGHFAVQPAAVFESDAEYAGFSAVLNTTFRTTSGAASLTDFMPLREGEGAQRFGMPRAQNRLVRIIEGIEGHVVLRIECRPRPSFGAEQLAKLSLRSSIPLTKAGEDSLADFTVSAGERAVLVLEWSEAAEPCPATAGWALRALDETLAFWRSWHRTCRYRGPYYDAVMRSLATLKLLTYAPTGAMVAAPTASLPEEIGGVRNWDYRYTWIRDASLAFHALLDAGHSEDTRRFMQWVCEMALRCEPGGLQIMYGVRGERDLTERSIDGLEGYRASSPVRVGNQASTQFQLDVYGELLECFEVLRRSGEMPEQDLRDMWPAFSGQVDAVARRWREPDCGIWEVRSAPRHFIHSKVLAWVALDRGIRAAQAAGLPADVARWRREREAAREEVLSKGYDERLGAFVQSYGSELPDAANLLLPIVGFIEASDPRMRSTVEVIQARLLFDGLVYRYRGAEDGVPGGEASFAVCTFWLVENLVLLGRADEAREIFEAMLARATRLGLFAEELEPRTQAHLGNFPQALTHIGLINAAVALARP